MVMASDLECEFLDYQTKSISLERGLPGPYSTNSQYVARWTSQMFDLLYPVMQPLSAYLWLRGRRGDWPVLEHVFDPGDYVGRIREEEWPSHVSTPPALKTTGRERVVTRLTDRELSRWVREQTEITPTPDEYVAELATVEITHCRARLGTSTDDSIDGLRLLRHDRHIASVPVEVASDGLWVSGPAIGFAGHYLKGPLGFDIWNNDVSFHASLDIRWSLWAEPGSEAYRLLMVQLGRALAAGWAVTSMRGSFDISTESNGSDLR